MIAKITEGLVSLDRAGDSREKKSSENLKRRFQDPGEKRAGNQTVLDLAANPPGLDCISKFSVILKAQGFSLDVPELKRAAVLNAVKVKGAAAGRGHSADFL